MFVQIKGSRLFVGFFFLEVVARSITNACPNQGLKIFCWFFLEVVARLGTNACRDQVLKNLCWFFFKSCC